MIDMKVLIKEMVKKYEYWKGSYNSEEEGKEKLIIGKKSGVRHLQHREKD